MSAPTSTSTSSVSPDSRPTGERVARSRRSFITGALLGGAGGVLGATVIGATTATTAAAQAVDPVDVGFCTDMATHHMQALAMCERVLGHDTGDAVQEAAVEVLRNQAIEIGMMRAWLTDWGASTVPPETVMAWMAMDHSMTADDAMSMDDGIPLAEMPGYATDAELLSLSRADGVAKGRLWLQLMRAHHVGGVMMAEAAVGMASADKVIRLARTQAEVQAWEIGQYDQLLATTYA